MANTINKQEIRKMYLGKHSMFISVKSLQKYADSWSAKPGFMRACVASAQEGEAEASDAPTVSNYNRHLHASLAY